MKIWKAELILSVKEDKSIINKFYFEKQNEEYEVNKSFPDKEWTGSNKKWFVYKIPKHMKIYEYYGNFCVEQGFDRELNSDELIEVENNMKEFLKKHLINKKENTIKSYDSKIASLEITDYKERYV